MRRIIIALCLFLATAAEAATVNLYADNRIVATGTAQASGSSTTTLKVASFSTLDTSIAATHADLVNMGIHIMSGSANNISTDSRKITAVDTTDPAKPVFTINAAFDSSETPEDDWTFTILYGSNINTGASQTKGASTTGPVNSIHFAFTSSALADQDIGHVHIRGNTGNNYSQLYGPPAGTTDRLIYNAFIGSTKSFILEGYVTTAIPSDLATDAVKSSTYLSTGVTNPARAVNVSAGAALYADTTTTNKFPHLRYTDASPSYSLAVGDPAATSPGLTCRYLKITHPSTNGSSSVVNMQGTSTNPNLTIESCVLGSLDATDDNAYVVSNTTTGWAPTNTVSISKSVLLNRRHAVSYTTCRLLSIDQCYVECYGKDNAGSTVTGLFGLKVDNVAATYNAAMSPTNQVRRVSFTDNKIVHTATHSAASTTAVGIQMSKPTEMEYCKIHGNNLELYSRAAGMLFNGVSGLDVQSNKIVVSNATAVGVCIGVGADASPESFPTGTTHLLVASGTCDANGSQVAADGGTPLALPAHSTFKLTGGSATNDAYNGLQVWKINVTNGIQKSVVWDYDGTTKIAKCSAQFGATPANGDRWELHRPRQFSHGVIAHNFGNCPILPTTSSHGYCLFQGADHIDLYDNTMIGYYDDGLVVKGEFNRCWNNRLYAGRGTPIIKGGSWNEIRNNTFVCANANGGGACFIINDKSNVHNLNSGESRVYPDHDSKTTGNRITDNIIIADDPTGGLVFDDSNVGLNSWAGLPSAYPASQSNVFDYNIYYQATPGADFGTLNGAAYDGDTTTAEWRAAWQSYTAATQYGATNDQNSIVGFNPRLVDPANGNFSPQIRVLGSNGQMIGAQLPANRANRLPILNAN